MKISVATTYLFRKMHKTVMTVPTLKIADFVAGSIVLKTAMTVTPGDIQASWDTKTSYVAIIFTT